MARILVVDDDISFRKMLRLTLSRSGHAVCEARDGDEALEVIREAPVDLVMTDLIMPGREGIETITALRREFPGLKIIAMSGGGRATACQYLSIARAIGAHRTLAKPFSNDEMVAAIAAVLGCAAGTGSGPSRPPLKSAGISRAQFPASGAEPDSHGAGKLEPVLTATPLPQSSPPS
jgi:DNA-binding response OmpR family regulator